MNLEELTREIEATGRELFGADFNFASVNISSIAYQSGRLGINYTANLFRYEDPTITVQCQDYALLSDLLRLEHSRQIAVSVSITLS